MNLRNEIRLSISHPDFISNFNVSRNQKILGNSIFPSKILMQFQKNPKKLKNEKNVQNHGELLIVVNQVGFTNGIATLMKKIEKAKGY